MRSNYSAELRMGIGILSSTGNKGSLLFYLETPSRRCRLLYVCSVKVSKLIMHTAVVVVLKYGLYMTNAPYNY